MEQTERIKYSRILIIDSDADTRAQMRDMLYLQGYQEVLVGPSGAESLEIADRERLDLILLDIMMPDIDGFQVCKELQQNPRTQHIPIIVVAARKSSQDLQRSFDQGAIDYITKPIDPVEFVARTKSALKIKHAYDEIRSMNQYLEQLSTIDELTNLKNVRFFWDYLATECNKFIRFKQPISLVMADIDDFKRINDTYGHLVGDEVLRRSGEIFHKTLRDYDLAARYGGEEFAFVLVNTNRHTGEIVAEKVRRAVNRVKLDIKSHSLQYTISLGVAALDKETAPEHINAQSLVDRADQALLRAKQEGKNRVCSAS